jgi:hypothetical protein
MAIATLMLADRTLLRIGQMKRLRLRLPAALCADLAAAILRIGSVDALSQDL